MSTTNIFKWTRFNIFGILFVLPRLMYFYHISYRQKNIKSSVTDTTAQKSLVL